MTQWAPTPCNELWNILSLCGWDGVVALDLPEDACVDTLEDMRWDCPSWSEECVCTYIQNEVDRPEWEPS